jgi:MFS family permease
MFTGGLMSVFTAPHRVSPRTRPGTTLLIVCAAIVLVPISATGASLALPSVNDSLHTGLSAAQWVVNGFFLTFASFMAITGSLADLTGRRRMFAGGVALFAGAMVVAAAAPNFWVLIAARALAGAGAAATTTGGSALLAQAFPGERRTRAFAVFGTAIGLGLAFGPLISGVLITSLGGWRMFFLAAALVLLPVLAATPLLTESSDHHGAPADRAGAVTFTLGLSLFVVAMVEGPSLGWGSPLVVAALAVFAVLIVGFGVVEKRTAHPMIDVSLLANPRFAAICAMPILLAFSFVALLIVLPPYFSAVDGSSAERAGLLLILLTGPTLVVPVIVARIAERVPQRALLIATMVLVAVGSAWLTVLRPGVPIGAVAGPLLTLGVGFGISLAIMDGAAISSVEPSRAGMAAGVFNTARLTGEAVAIAVVGAILAAVTQSDLAATVGASSATSATSRLLQGDMDGALAVLGSSDLRAVAADSYTEAMHVAFWALAALMVLGAVAVGVLTGRPVPLAAGEVGRPGDRELAGDRCVG